VLDGANDGAEIVDGNMRAAGVFESRPIVSSEFSS